MSSSTGWIHPGPISPLGCDQTGCDWRVHGVPDQYHVGALARHVAEAHMPADEEHLCPDGEPCPPHDEPVITEAVANHVLWSEGLGGYPPGSFTTALLAAWSGADYVNSARLAAGWPGYAAAFTMLSEPNGVERLRVLAEGKATQ